jgi:hypothetical protein
MQTLYPTVITATTIWPDHPVFIQNGYKKEPQHAFGLKLRGAIRRENRSGNPSKPMCGGTRALSG